MKKIALPVSETNQITNVETIQSLQGCGCKSNIAGILAENGVTLMLAGGIGNGAINVLNSHGIEVVRGCEGPADEAVNNYLIGQISDSGISCSHHGSDHSHDHGHQCSH
jgi:predicted Fe-Mo cluster-binding NifX family protein